MTPGNHLSLLFFLHVLLVQLEDGLTLNMIMTSNSITYNLGKYQIKQQTSIPPSKSSRMGGENISFWLSRGFIFDLKGDVGLLFSARSRALASLASSPM